MVTAWLGAPYRMLRWMRAADNGSLLRIGSKRLLTQRINGSSSIHARRVCVVSIVVVVAECAQKSRWFKVGGSGGARATKRVRLACSCSDRAPY